MFLLLFINLAFGENIVEVQKDDIVPYNGVLLPKAKFQELAGKIEYQKEICELEKAKALQLQKIELDYNNAVGNTDLVACEYMLNHTQNVFDNYRQNQIENYNYLQKKSTYNYILGFASGVAIMTLSAWTYSQIN